VKYYADLLKNKPTLNIFSLFSVSIILRAIPQYGKVEKFTTYSINSVSTLSNIEGSTNSNNIRFRNLLVSI